MTAFTDQKNKSMSAPKTAEYLAEALGGTPAHWATWLANDRRPGRVKRMLQAESGPGRPRYTHEHISTFVATYPHKPSPESKKPDGPQVTYGTHKFSAHISAVTQNDGAETPFIVLVTVSPLRTYKLTAADARQLARRLSNAADEADTDSSPLVI